ncbi:formimidoylglutamase [Shewanella maritima]|uniref:formimidoylglutamase n=1 Tax=Shewanella maritima TaxID=2520507 RepID=UPI003735B5C2
MLTLFNEQVKQHHLKPRDGEIKLGQQVQLLPQDKSLDQSLLLAKQSGAKFALIGIAEDVGPRANLGRGGANIAFNAFLSQWLNLQSNRFLNGNECVVIGEVSLNEVTSASLTTDSASIGSLRKATEQLDAAVTPVINSIFAAGLEPIVIGGGHNNAYPILMAAKQAFNQSISAINLDPHCDFRPREGRHSGNGFSYAAANGALNYYHVLGLHELKNSEASLEQLSLFGGTWHTYQQIWLRREISLTQALEDACKQLNRTQLPVGVEIDVDAITAMPSSASTCAGVPLADACHYLFYLGRHTPSAYCHLAEAAPCCHSAGEAAGYKHVGQSLSELVYAYIQGRSQARV